MNIRLNLLLLAASCLTAATAQTKDYSTEITAHQHASNYFAYPYLDNVAPRQTPAPKGYVPFHLEHYGRHGSRYLIDEKQYTRSVEILEIAERNRRLTPLGQRVLDHVRDFCPTAENRGGDLSDRGALQHKAIARRMAENYPEIFMTDAYVNARSTIVERCILSMLNGLDALHTANPSLKITSDASRADMHYMNLDHDTIKAKRSHGTRTAYKKFSKCHANKGDFINKLIDDPKFAADSIDMKALFNDLFPVLANDQSHIGREWLLEEVFTPEEIHQRWLCRNAKWFIHGGNSKITENIVPYIQGNLLTNIIESADTAMVSSNTSANLRYGHDGVVLPLAVLMEIDDYGREINDLEDLGEIWRDYLVIPMAANIQMIFYRPEGSVNPDEVLVKVMLNEREVRLPVDTYTAPYYPWSALRRYYMDKLSSNTIK